MGCLNPHEVEHTFANVHLSGRCPRSCYFCIGQHMKAVEHIDTLSVWPLPGWERFIQTCQDYNVREVYITGTNAEPLLFEHHGEFVKNVRERIPGVLIGLRTAGIPWTRAAEFYDQVSVTFCSFDRQIHQAMMGAAAPADLAMITGKIDPGKLWVNVPLGRRNTGEDLKQTLLLLLHMGILRVNLRELYGQPHIGNPLNNSANFVRCGEIYGAPRYIYGPAVRPMIVTYWDVHYVRVGSINLFANGHVSKEYAVTKAVDFDRGPVVAQPEDRSAGKRGNMTTEPSDFQAAFIEKQVSSMARQLTGMNEATAREVAQQMFDMMWRLGKTQRTLEYVEEALALFRPGFAANSASARMITFCLERIAEVKIEPEEEP
jgi:hypothetical protein